MRFEPPIADGILKDAYENDEIVTLSELIPLDPDDLRHDFDMYSSRCNRCHRSMEELLEDNETDRCIPF